MTLRTIAIDDEPLGLQVLADDLRQIPSVQLIATFSSPLKAVEMIREGKVDLMLLDIQMPTLLGTEFLRSLPTSPLVIFTTAYEQYALEGYELNAVDYLLKPIRFERLLKACNKAAEVFGHRNRPAAEPQADTSFFVYSGYSEVKIHHHDVLYVEGLKDYVKIYRMSEPTRPILTRLNVKAIETRLASARFCRVHQSFIIPLDRVVSFQKTKLTLQGGPRGLIEIPIGGRYADEFLSKYRGR